jgi:hypothetical protein
MPIIFLLECWAMDNVDPGVIRVEESRYEDVCGGLRRELRQNLCFRCSLLLTVQKGGAGWMFIAVTGLVSLQLVIVLLLVFCKVIFDFGELHVVSHWYHAE